MAWSTTSADYESSISSIKLITPVRYNAEGKTWLGDLISSLGGKLLSAERAISKVREALKAHEADLVVKKSKDGKLTGFFTKQELEDIAIRAGNAIKQRSPSLYDGIKLLTTEVSNSIVDRVLEKVAAISSANRRLWSQKIIAPFQHCIDKAGGPMEAMGCLDAFAAGLSSNIGLAVVFEAGYAGFSKSLEPHEAKALLAKLIDGKKEVKKTKADDLENRWFNYNGYKACLERIGNLHMEKCALEVMRNAIVEVAMPKVKAKIRSKITGIGAQGRLKSVLAALTGSFENCLAKEKDKDGFLRCGDTLTIEAGQRVVNDNILHLKPVVERFPAESAREKLSKEQQKDFKKCALKQKDEGKRVDGIIDIDPCAELVQNQVTYKVAPASLKKAIDKAFIPDEPATRAEIEASKAGAAKVYPIAIAALDGCWQDYQAEPAREACLRTAASATISSIASIQVELGTSSVYLKEETAQDTLAVFNGCVKEHLPEIISTSENIAESVNPCVGSLRSSAALGFSEYTLRKKAAEGKLDETTTEELIDDEVKTKFTECLGSEPPKETLDRCVVDLKKSAAKAIAKLRFPVELDALVTKADKDKPQEVELRQTKLAKASDKVFKNFETCINRDITYAKGKQADALMDGCIKQGVDDIARAVATLELDSKLLPLYKGAPERGLSAQSQVIDYLNVCLATKTQTKGKAGNGAETIESVDDRIEHAKRCGDRLLDRATLIAIKDQLELFLQDLEVRKASAIGEDPNGCRKKAETPFPEIEAQAKSMLSTMGGLVDLYTAYDLAKAKRDIGAVIAQINQELDGAGTPQSRKELLDWLIRNTTAVDQLVKAKVRDEVVAALAKLSPEQQKQIPPALVARLSDKTVFDAMFSTAAGREIVKKVVDGIVTPAFVQGKPMSSLAIVAAEAEVERKVKDFLVDSPEFGGVLVRGVIETGIESELPAKWLKDTFPKFYKAVAGVFGYSLVWDDARKTAAGIEAEAFVRDQIIKPSFRGKTISDSKMAELKKKACEKVEAALKAAAASSL